MNRSLVINHTNLKFIRFVKKYFGFKAFTMYFPSKSLLIAIAGQSLKYTLNAMGN